MNVRLDERQDFMQGIPLFIAPSNTAGNTVRQEFYFFRKAVNSIMALNDPCMHCLNEVRKWFSGGHAGPKHSSPRVVLRTMEQGVVQVEECVFFARRGQV